MLSSSSFQNSEMEDNNSPSLDQATTTATSSPPPVKIKKRPGPPPPSPEVLEARKIKWRERCRANQKKYNDKRRDELQALRELKQLLIAKVASSSTWKKTSTSIYALARA